MRWGLAHLAIGARYGLLLLKLENSIKAIVYHEGSVVQQFSLAL